MPLVAVYFNAVIPTSDKQAQNKTKTGQNSGKYSLILYSARLGKRLTQKRRTQLGNKSMMRRGWRQSQKQRQRHVAKHKQMPQSFLKQFLGKAIYFRSTEQQCTAVIKWNALRKIIKKKQTIQHLWQSKSCKNPTYPPTHLAALVLVSALVLIAPDWNLAQLRQYC